MKDMKRADRRHHIARLKETRKHYFVVTWWSEEYRGKRLGIVVQHPKMCSCMGCGNPRKWFGDRTIAELRDLDRFDTGMEDLSHGDD